MDHIWESGAVQTAPNPPSTPSSGYPVAGFTPTTPGPYWFYMITEEIRNAIMAGGVTPSTNSTNQLAQAIALIAAQNSNGGTGSGQGAFTTLTNPFTMPVVGGSTTAIVQSTVWTAPGAYVFIPGAGTLLVQGISSSNSMTLANTGITNNIAAGTVIPTQTQVIATGQVGPQGASGVGAYSTVTTAFTQPTVGGNVQVRVGNTTWMVVSQPIFITIGGNYSVSQILDEQNVLLINLGGSSNATAGSTVPAGAGIGAGGSVGPQGTAGVAGPGAYTTVTQSFTVPNVGSSSSISVGNALWMTPGQTVYVATAGHYYVSSVTNSQTVVLTNLGYTGNSNPGIVVVTGSSISPSGVPGAAGVQGVSAYTTLSNGYTQPAIGSNVVVQVATTAFTSIGQYIYVQNGGCYQVQGITDGQLMSLTNIGTVGNAAPASVVAGGGAVSVSGPPGANGTGTGTVTSLNVLSANGFTGNVNNPSTNPSITLQTTATGILKGVSGALTAAIPGTDYPGLTSANGFSQLQTYNAGINLGGASSPILLTGSPGNAGQALLSMGAGVTPQWTTLNFGTVTAVAVTEANGFSGSVNNSTTTPTISIIAKVTGILKSNGSAISAAVAGQDYAVPNLNNNWTALQSYTGGVNLSGTTAPFQVNGSTGTAGQMLMSQGTGNTPVWVTLAQTTGTVTSMSVTNTNGFAGTVANAGTTPAITITATPSGMLKSNGTAMSAATAGTDFIAPGVNANYTAILAILGTTSNPGLSLTNGMEVANMTGSPPAATQTIYASAGQYVIFAQATANWVFNITWSSIASISSAMNVNGGTIVVTAKVPQGSTAYYMTSLKIDGTVVTPKWMGSSGAPTAGHASSDDIYSFIITRTAANTYTVNASMTQFQ